MPSFSGLPTLERLILKYCISLVEIHESIGELSRLLVLNLKGCKSLAELPSTISQLKSLEKLILSGCSKLCELPVELGKMPKTVICADGTAMHVSPFTTDALKKVSRVSARLLQSLFQLWMSPARSPNCNQFSLAFLPCSLKSLELMDCNLSDNAPPILCSCLSSLQHLNLAGNPISCLPESIKDLTMLKSLILNSCTGLQTLPELPPNLDKLHAYSCTALERLPNLPNLLTGLDLILHHCDKLVEIQGLFKLEPIATVGANIINDLGFADLEFMRNTEVELYHCLTGRRKKGPVQGWYEFGIFSIYLPGSQVPGWFRTKSTSPLLCLVVPSPVNAKPLGMSICVVCSKAAYDYGTNFVLIHNLSKNLTYCYCPILFCCPEDNNDVMFLSNWNFGKKLEGGDRVQILVLFDCDGVKMKEWGVRFLYEKNDTTQSNRKEKIQRNAAYPSLNNVIDGDLSPYDPLMNSNYLLNHQNLKHLMNFRRPVNEWNFLSDLSYKEFFGFDDEPLPWVETNYLEAVENRDMGSVSLPSDSDSDSVNN